MKLFYLKLPIHSLQMKFSQINLQFTGEQNEKCDNIVNYIHFSAMNQNKQQCISDLD